MMVQSPLKRRNVQPNLRKVSKPDIAPSSSSTKKGNKRKNKQAEHSGTGFPTLKPGTLILASIIIGVLGFAYITHVFATQRLLREVQQLETEYNKARQHHDELKLRYDRLIGPAEIYEKAKAQGFINGGPADHILEVQK